MIPASGAGGIHELIGMIQSVQSVPEVGPQPRRDPGVTDADLADLSAQAYQLRQARDALAANQAAPASPNIEQFTAEAIAGGTPATRRQRPGSSLGINT